MTLVLVGKGQCFGGLNFKNSGHFGFQVYTYMIIYDMYKWMFIYNFIYTPVI